MFHICFKILLAFALGCALVRFVNRDLSRSLPTTNKTFPFAALCVLFQVRVQRVQWYHLFKPGLAQPSPASGKRPLFSKLHCRNIYSSTSMSDIQQCQSLVAQLGGEYNNEDRTTYIDITPEKILQISTMALWAQSTSGQRQINLGLPSLKTWLKNLAANGPGRPRHTKVSHTNLSSVSFLVISLKAHS